MAITSPGARGALLMAGSAAAFAVMTVMIRHVSAELHPFEIAFFRNLFGLVAALPWLLRAGGHGLLRTTRFGLYFLRCVIGLGAMLGGFWAIANMPLSQAVALGYTTPLWVTILAALVLGEVVRLRRWTAVAVGFLGVLVILRPGLTETTFAAWVALGAAGLAAAAAISIKFLSRTEPAEAIVIWMVLIMTPLSLFPALPYWQWPEPGTWAWLALIGITGTLGHIWLTRAFKHADASALMPIEFLKLPFVAAIAWVAFNEAMDLWTAIGAGIIFASTVYIAHREAQLSRPQVTDPKVATGPPS